MCVREGKMGGWLCYGRSLREGGEKEKEGERDCNVRGVGGVKERRGEGKRKKKRLAM